MQLYFQNVICAICVNAKTLLLRSRKSLEGRNLYSVLKTYLTLFTDIYNYSQMFKCSACIHEIHTLKDANLVKATNTGEILTLLAAI
jgi:hypothetical protein